MTRYIYSILCSLLLWAGIVPMPYALAITQEEYNIAQSLTKKEALDEPVIPPQNVFTQDNIIVEEVSEPLIIDPAINYNNIAQDILYNNEHKEPDISAQEHALLIAQLAKNPPRYSKGDYYVLSNPDIVWTVVNVAKGLVYWQSDTGAQQVTYQNPLLPALEWDSTVKGRGKRILTSRQGTIFPLGVDNDFSFISSVTTDQEPYSWQVEWYCRIVESLNGYKSPIGKTTIYRVNCGRSPNVTEISFLYAPVVGYYVAMEFFDANNNLVQRRELKDYGNHALAYLEKELITTPAEFKEDTADNNFSTQQSLEETDPVIDLVYEITPELQPISDTGEQRGGSYSVPTASPNPPNNRIQQQGNNQPHDASTNFNSQQQISDNSPLDAGPLVPYEKVDSFNDNAVVTTQLPASTLPEFPQNVYDISVNDLRKNGQKTVKEYAEPLPSDTIEQGIALLKKRFKDRLNTDNFVDNDESLDTNIIHNKAKSDSIHAYFDLPAKIIRPNRPIEAYEDHVLERPRGLTDLNYERDLISNAQYFEQTNPEYQEIDAIQNIENQRISNFTPKSIAQLPDQLAFAREPVYETWAEIASPPERDLAEIYDLNTIKNRSAQEIQRYKQRNDANQPIGKNFEDLYYYQGVPSRQLQAKNTVETQRQKQLAQAQQTPKPQILELALTSSKKEAAIIWQRTLAQDSQILNNLQPSTQRVALADKGIFYKLLAIGPISETAARERCRILLTQYNICRAVNQQ